VLTEYTTKAGNFPTITRVLLSKLSFAEGKMSYVYDDKFVFHYVVDQGITYMCMCDDLERKRAVFAFLEDVKQRFSSLYGLEAQTARAFAMNDRFKETLRSQMEYYNNPANDRTNSVSSKIDEVKNIMVENIEMVLEGGEKLELLVDKTDALQRQACQFEMSTKQIRFALFWRQVQIYLLVCAITAFILWLLTSLICGFDYGQCSQ
jgi:vesicle-associated membrane protein 7